METLWLEAFEERVCEAKGYEERRLPPTNDSQEVSIRPPICSQVQVLNEVSCL